MSGVGLSPSASPSRRELAAFVALAAAVRLLVSWRTVVPGRDGASYLWMAERVGAGDPGAAFRTVFHPLYSLATGLVLAALPDLSPMAAGQLVAGTAAALAIWPLQVLTASWFGVSAGRSAALLYACGVWFVRYPAECLSEGCFYLLVAVWALAVLGRRPASAAGGQASVRPALAGLAAALAYATRPEGLALLVIGGVRLRGRARLRLLVTGAACAIWVPIGYWLSGSGFTLTPKAAFNYAVGIGADDSAVRHYLVHALRLPGAAFEAIGYIAVPLAVVGLWLCWRQGRLRGGDAAPWLLAPLLVQSAVVPMLRSNARFLSGFGHLLLPFAGLAMAAWLGRRRVGSAGARWRPLVTWLVVLAPDLARLPGARGEDRLIERRLGEWLRPRLHAPDFIATEMPRLEFFAGQQPGPPRPIGRDELLSAAARAHARFVAVVSPRSDIVAADLDALGLQAVSLPEPLSTLARQRALLVYERR